MVKIIHCADFIKVEGNTYQVNNGGFGNERVSAQMIDDQGGLIEGQYINVDAAQCDVIASPQQRVVTAIGDAYDQLAETGQRAFVE